MAFSGSRHRLRDAEKIVASEIFDTRSDFVWYSALTTLAAFWMVVLKTRCVSDVTGSSLSERLIGTLCSGVPSNLYSISLILPVLGDCDNPVARACRGKKSKLSPFLISLLGCFCLPQPPSLPCLFPFLIPFWTALSCRCRLVS